MVMVMAMVIVKFKWCAEMVQGGSEQQKVNDHGG